MSTDYGTDFDCVSDLTDTLGTVSGRTLLGQALARRITTARGTLFSDPNYGIDIREALSDGFTPRQLAQLAPRIDAELAKDERVLSTSTTCALAGGVLTVSIVVTDGAGPFSLVLNVSDGGVTVEVLEAA